MKINNALEIEFMEEILKRGNDLHFKALGNSMYPLIRSGDIITVKPVKSKDIGLGDVIFYKNKDKLFVHRLIKIINNKSIFITRGDFLPYYDDPIDSSQILGKIVAVKRQKKIISYNTYWRQKFNYLIILIYPLFYSSLKWINGVLSILFKLKKDLISLSGYIIRKLKKSFTYSISYHKASNDDLNSLANFYKTDSFNVLENMNKGSLYFCAKSKDKIIGAVIVGKSWSSICPNKWWIMSLYIKPGFKGRGIGQNLLLTTITELRKLKIKKIYLNLFENNIPALNLYKKLGFKNLNMPKIEKQINEYYEDKADGSYNNIILYREI